MNDKTEKAREMKEILDLRETEFLNPLACFSHTAQRRLPDKYQDVGYRQSFSADADRILNSLAYTRYIDKTQVFSLIKNDHLTHRVLHVQLVSRIARTIGRFLGLNEDLLEAASLGHDIGHPPFGHDGERMLSKLIQEKGGGFFHHNTQSIQFLDKIERNGRGWNLTLQTMDAIVCHNGEVFTEKIKPERNRTFDDFYKMLDDHKNKRHFDMIPMTMEGCVVRIADTISYIGRDLEDAIRLGMIQRDDIPELCKETLGKTNGTIVHNLVTDLIANSMRQPFIGFSQNVAEALKKLKQFNYKNIYLDPKIKKHLNPIKDIFAFLVEKFFNDLEKENLDSSIFKDFLNGLSQNYLDHHSNIEIVRDYISGMTDSYFIRLAPENMKPEYIEYV